MEGFLGKIGASFAGMWRQSEGLNVKSIRPLKLHYALAYTFELVFYLYHKTFLYTDSKLFGFDGNTLMYIGHILVSLVIMLLWSEKFRHLIYVSVAMTMLSFSLFLLMPGGVPKLLCAVLTMAGLGGSVTCARCGFAFAANNAERLLGVVSTLGARALLYFVDAALPDGSFWDNAIFMYIYPIITLVGLVFCLLHFEEGDLEFKETSTPADSRGLYWAFVIFIVYFAVSGHIEAMENTLTAPYGILLRGIGCLIAIMLFVSILVSKRTIWHIWNLFLVVSIATVTLYNFNNSPLIEAATHLLRGLAGMGWIAVLYILACAQRRFASLKLLKQCTVVFVIISPFTTLSDELVQMFFPDQMPLISLVYVLVIALAFFMASPSIYKYLFSAVWIDDLQKTDMGRLRDKVEQTDRFENYCLTPREKEVAALLLTANTMRMIAGELKISQSTVNMHAANLYRKLGINSKAELFKKFGVAEKSKSEA